MLDWCLGHLRRTYFESTIFVIGDGPLLDYQDVCDKHYVRYVRSERLKGISSGAKWWDRFLKTAVSLAKPDDRYIIKFDPDTKFRRRFRYIPNEDCSGSLEPNGNLPGGKSIQGGMQCISLDAAQKIIDSGIAQDARFRDIPWWSPNQYVTDLFSSKQQISTDHILTKIINELGLTWCGWGEVDSKWFGNQWRNDAAVTHPHKEDWKHPKVDVVISHYKRPQNIPAILDRFREQTIPVRITLLDCHPLPELALDDRSWNRADRHFRFHNYGTANRHYLASAFWDCDYVYFHDDDMLPGVRAVEHLVQTYQSLEKPGILGEFGRLIRNGRYVCAELPLQNSPQRVSSVVRGYFTMPNNLLALQELWSKMQVLVHDDLALSASQEMCGRRNYIVSAWPDRSYSICERELDAPHAMCGDNSHGQYRQKACNQLFSLGWVPYDPEQ